MSDAAWHRVGAFGLQVDSESPIACSCPVAGGDPGATRLRRISPEEYASRIGGDAELIDERHAFGERVGTIERDEAQYRFTFKGFGRYLVTVDGTEICCPSGEAPAEAQERFVFAQVLPLAAALRGFELLHASAVGAGDSVAAFLGRSGAGKTTLMAQLVLRGAGFVTDDVLALEHRDGVVIAHPGPPFLGVVDGTGSARDDAAVRLGRVTGRSDKVHVSLPTAARAMPLGRLYHLERGPRLEISRLTGEGVAPRLLANAFAPYLSTPERLGRQFDIIHRLTHDAAEFRLQVPHDAEPEATVEAVEAHLRQAVGSC